MSDIAARELANAVALANAAPKWSAEVAADGMVQTCAARVSRLLLCTDRIAAVIGREMAAIAAMASITCAISALVNCGIPRDRAVAILRQVLK